MDILALAQTDEFSDWLCRLKDRVAGAKILVRMKRLSEGNAGEDIAKAKKLLAASKMSRGPV